MRKTLIASLLAVSCIGFATADDTVVAQDKTRVRIELDQEAIGGLIRDLDAYTRSQGFGEIAQSSAGVVHELDNAFKNTFAKMMLNYGKMYAPVFEDLAEVSGKVLKLDGKKSNKCDQNCAVQCVDSSQLGSGRIDRLFDLQCVNQCGCVFAFQTMTPKEQQKVEKDIQAL